MYSFVIFTTTLPPFQEGADTHACAHSTFLPEDSSLSLFGLQPQLVATAVIHTSDALLRNACGDASNSRNEAMLKSVSRGLDHCICIFVLPRVSCVSLDKSHLL